jgi:uncharacterized protein YdaU (DUF1376 family)
MLFDVGAWMSDPHVQVMNFEQRGRYHWALCCSWGTPTPGIASEDAWRTWMGYSGAEWAAHRGTFAPCFKARAGGWVQERLRATAAAARRRDSAASAKGRQGAYARWLGSSLKDDDTAQPSIGHRKVDSQVPENSDTSMPGHCPSDGSVKSTTTPPTSTPLPGARLLSSFEALREGAQDERQAPDPRALVDALGRDLAGRGASLPPEGAQSELQRRLEGLPPLRRRPAFRFVGWLVKTGVKDPGLALSYLEHFLAHQPDNPFAYYAPGGPAREVIERTHWAGRARRHHARETKATDQWLKGGAGC